VLLGLTVYVFKQFNEDNQLETNNFCPVRRAAHLIYIKTQSIADRRANRRNDYK
jgi:hypothetical protein